MKSDDIIRMAHDIVDRCSVENDFIEYKKSSADVVKDGILKTACAYAYVQVIREAIGTDKMEGKVFDGPIWIQA